MVWSKGLLFALLASLVCQQATAETVLLEFTSPTCGPCRGMRPVMEQLKKARYDVREVDASQEPGLGLAKQFRVENLPTFVVVVDGKERARLVGGNTSLATLVEMIHKSTAIAQQKAASALVDIRPVSAINGATPPAASDAAAFQPQPGRVVPVDMQPAVSRSQGRGQGAAANVDRLVSATVRISIDDADGTSTGTGTIVDARDGKALVLTCGHLFRTSGGKGPIEISLFSPGPNGAELKETVEGALIDYDLERDLALVCFAPEADVTVAPVAPAGVQMKVGDPATAVGCAHGENPAPWATQITAIDRYQGTPNIEAARAPVEGRSGGGLFNAAGQLVGVCNAADPQRDEGLYAALPSIYAKLDALQIAFVYQSPSLGSTPTASLATLAAASARSPFEVRGQNPAVETPPFPAPSPSVASAAGGVPATASTATAVAGPAPATTAATELSPQDRALLEEIRQRGADAEVICIISPREPGGQSQVIKLNGASPALVQALGGTSTATATTAAAAATADQPLAR